MKLAGVSINKQDPPKKEELIQLAVKSRKFQNYSPLDALELATKEIEKSGLYKSSTEEIAKSVKPSAANSGAKSSDSGANDSATDKK